MFKFQRIWRLVTIAALLTSVLNLSLVPIKPVYALSTDVVISQVYGGGGNSGSTYTNDYIELFNLGTVAVNLTGWSVQYGSATGSTWTGKTDLTGTIQPGQYLLIQEAAGTGGTTSLPTPDILGAIAMGGTAGKVALVNNTTVLSGACPTGLIDMVGYGPTANCSETSPTAVLSSALAAKRNTNGCTEADNNSTDFTVADPTVSPTPRNTGSPLNPCSGGTPNLTVNDVTLAEGDAGATTFTFTVSLSSPAPVGDVTFDIATADDVATIADNDYVTNSLASQTILAGNLSITFDVTVNGDTTTETDETFFVNVTNATNATITDGQGVGTITNDDNVLPVLSINDATVTEGNLGTALATFTVSLDIPAGPSGVTFDIATADGTATLADSDYVTNSATGATIAAGNQTYTFDVTVNGDAIVEPDETFAVNVTGVSGATLGDGLGLGTITNDDFVITPIYDIQGSGLASGMVGSTVTTEGVVVGDYEGGVTPQIRGFYIQDATGDANSATSDGIFVYDGNNAENVALGDLVRVTGAVSEFSDQTQISTGSITVLSSGNTITPTDIILPFASAAEQEQYESMLVRVPQTLYVTEMYLLGRFGQVTLSSSGKLRQPTNVVLPGTPANDMQATNNLNKIILDDASQSQNPDPILFGRGGNPLSASNTLRGGDTLTGLVGVFNYTWGGNSASANAYRIRPINAMGGGVPNFVAANARPATAPVVGGSVKAVGMNMLNYFNTFADNNIGTPGCFPSGTDTDCRGANDATEFTRQSDKIVNAILTLDADVIGIAEIENDGYDSASAIQDLVNKLNAATTPGTYAFINPDATLGVNSLGLDAIKVGLLYQPAKVTPVGTTAVLNTTAFINGGDSGPRNRASLLQAFQSTGGETFLMNVNHLKSKGSACDVADAGDGQGNCNLVRLAAVNELLTWFATNPTGTGDPDLLVVGDLNSYAKEDPIAAFETANYTNLAYHFDGANAYSYVFDGQWGYLDYGLASSSLLAQTAGFADWHINSDEPSVLDYNTEFKSIGQITSLYSQEPFRTSDHDPVLVGLSLDSVAPDTQIDTHPADPSTSASADFTFSSADLTATFECALDAGVFAGCSSPINYPSLSDGLHTFQVHAKDAIGNTDATPASFSWTIDAAAPSVLSSTLVNTSPTAKANVNFTVRFSEPVTGVDVADFTLTAPGITGASVTNVTTVSSARYTVTVHTGSGNGSLRLDVIGSPSIQDLAGNALAGPYTSGNAYIVNKTLVFNSLALNDGWVLESSRTSEKGGTTYSKWALRVGDDRLNRQYRSIMHFNTLLPANAVITSVTLKIKKLDMTGNPFAGHGNLIADIRKGFFGNSGLEMSDFQFLATAGQKNNIGKFTAISGGWYQLNLGAANYQYLNRTGATQFRLRFALGDDNDKLNDYIRFFAGETTLANRPKLTIQYYIP